MRTLIKAKWIVANDGRGHTLLRDGVVVYEGKHILHVGRTFDGPVDRTIDAGVIPATYAIGDYVWSDTNEDGIQDAGEPARDVRELDMERDHAEYGDGAEAVDIGAVARVSHWRMESSLSVTTV